MVKPPLDLAQRGVLLKRSGRSWTGCLYPSNKVVHASRREMRILVQVQMGTPPVIGEKGDFEMARKTVKYLVRSQLSGVVIGELDTQGGQTVTLKNAQHIHTWQGGALSAFDLAASGPKDCKLSQKVDQVTIFDVFQIVKMSDVAITKFDGIKPWVAR